MWFFFINYHYPQTREHSETDDELNDSIWATVSGFCKTYNCSFDYVINDLSYQNLIMYSKVIPSYIPPDDRKKTANKKQLTKNEYNELIKNLSKH